MEVDQNEIQAKIEIAETFKKLFYNKGFTPSDYFSTDVWFLRDSNLLTNEGLQQSTTPSDFSDLLTILLKLNETDKMNLKVKVGNFVEAIASYIVSVSREEKTARRFVEEWNAEENKNVIEETLSILKARIESEEQLKFGSKLKIEVESLEGFNDGKYNLTLSTTHFVDMNMVRVKEHPVISVETTDNEISKVAASLRTAGETQIYPVAMDGYLTEDNPFNGSTVESIYFTVRRQDGEEKVELGRSEVKSFAVIFVAVLDKLLMMNKHEFSKAVVLEMKTEDGVVRINVRVHFLVNDELKVEVLKKVHFTLNRPITIKNASAWKMDFICDRLFPEISESIMAATAGILTNKGACCEKCNIF